MNISKITSNFSLLIFIGIVLFLGSFQKKPSTDPSTIKRWYQQHANASVIDSATRWDDDTEWLKALPLNYQM